MSEVYTGWFGIPGGPESASTLVHTVSNGQPTCGTRVGARQQFQWCAYGIHYEFLECGRCKVIARKAAKT